jgi:hypothetical protein
MLFTLHPNDIIKYTYYQNPESEDSRYTDWIVSRSMLHDNMLWGIIENDEMIEFTVYEYIPYLPIALSLSVQEPLTDNIFVYLQEQYTSQEVSLWKLHSRLGYRLNTTPHDRNNVNKRKLNFTSKRTFG